MSTDIVIEVLPKKPWYRTRLFRYSAYFVIVALLIGIVYISFTPVDKVIISPGSATPTDDSIHISGVKTYDTKGQIKFLTVLVSNDRPSIAEYWKARLFNKNSEILDWKEVNGNLTAQQSNEISEALMKQSQSSSAVVALNQLGCDINETGNGATITEVAKKAPAYGLLNVGEIVVGVNGIQTDTADQLVTEIQKHTPGDEIVLSVKKEKDSTAHDVSVTLGKRPDKKGVGFLGVAFVTQNQNYEFPIDIEIDPGDVSGPSAGLAFTLSIIDQLTDGDLTGGQTVSATGEIGLDGSVNPVGGVAQKAIAAKKAGSKIMLVPQGEGKSAKSKAGSMKVFEVSSVEDALKVLKKNGGDPIDHMQRCPT